ncbi:FABP family protein [Rhodococcus sp. BP-252]|uniref:FABP family protein n=1 Tax=unclassified Rhodococcus (in: high G+C Gram-positive bacteria) TaxID=192944 RepID=UPI001C9B7AE9|nr:MULTISPECIES: FABP family protein [unclassified Rhodococcus (in: high G+C Gram-positive bacteria)]MBY6412739.1 FABP family protein [Rhodococcus sp. BP-320]MBY6417463.1 FABP family protein [Rhodococcus sp. BP-321]MBY6421759.1 FABP family protein [Rhodococcus sp. BP-324]MBY6427498.1 FABP family protein [Rhodococcus sp. BP-323]MBY6432651.1 FABP family protein [Rhodococcus sp. BP-322]
MSDRAADQPDETRSGDEAIAEAAEKFASTSTRNIPTLPDLPHPDDTANLRLGPDLNSALLALLPLVGVWRGEGEGRDPESGVEYAFGQQIVVSHDGGPYLGWESRSWRLDSDGNYAHPDLREAGFWRVSGGDGVKGSENEEVLELLLTHSTGVVELYYGHALNQSSWELATDVVIRSTSGALVGGAKRLYGIVEGADLAYVEERIGADGELTPRLSARLSRYIG